jgi:hypothetical protein
MRRDASTWLASARETVLDNSPENKMEDDPSLPGFEAMLRDIVAAFEPRWRDDAALMAAYDRHNASVRRVVEPSRLIEWHAGDGWEPLCAGLGLPVPDEEFPHVNTRQEFRGQPSDEGNSEGPPVVAHGG